MNPRSADWRLPESLEGTDVCRLVQEMNHVLDPASYSYVRQRWMGPEPR
jgi:hypothetical protein